MNYRLVGTTTLASLLSISLGTGQGEAPAKKVQKNPTRVLRLGGVAYSPDSVTVFRNLRHYFLKNGMPIDYVLYSSYEAQVKALCDGQIDIAWNSPLAHGKYHLMAGGESQALVMRDVDCNYRCQLIVRREAGIARLDDLPGKTMVFGSCDSAEATVLPLYFLKKEGVSFDKIKVLSLHLEVDRFGCPCNSEQHVLKALKEGRGQAGIISQELWKQLQKDEPKTAAQLKVIWTSAPFSHCVFTAKKDFDKKLAARFTKLMLAMDSQDPVTAEILRLEHASRWVAGGQDGYSTLLQALRDADAVTLAK